MTHDKAHDMLEEVKAFAVAQKCLLDRRSKTYELVIAQLDGAYRVSCIVQGHLRVAERYTKKKGKP